MTLAMILASATAQQDTERTTMLWQFINAGDRTALERFVFRFPDVLEDRSADGRGGLWWAWEYRNVDAIALYLYFEHDISTTEQDDQGNTPKSMCESNCNQLSAEAKDLVADVKTRHADFEYEQEEAGSSEFSDNEEESDDDDDGSNYVPQPRQKPASKVVDEDDDDVFGGSIVPDASDE